MFLERFLNEHFPDFVAVHEPPPTRYQMMLANLRNDCGIGGGMLGKWYRSARAKRGEDAGKPLIELNPFLCPLIDLIPEEGRDLRVIHIVRHPATWAKSIAVFRASERFRRFIDVVPFAKPYPSPRPPKWHSMGDYERALHRWRWCNQQIEEIAPKCDSYIRIRYEELFSADDALAIKAVRQLCEALGLPPLDIDVGLGAAQRENASPPGKIEGMAKRGDDAIQDMAARYGYEL